MQKYYLYFRINTILNKSIFYLFITISKKLLSIILWFLFLPITILAHLLGYRVLNIFIDRIGHYAIEPACVIAEIQLGAIDNYKFIIPVNTKKVANKHLTTYWANRFIVTENWFNVNILKTMSMFGLMKYDTSKYLRNIISKNQAFSLFNKQCGNSPTLSINCVDLEWGKEEIIKLGIPEHAWYVCVHARSVGFSPVDDEIQKYRNNDINKMIKAIKYITSTGGWVVVMGDKNAIPLPNLSNTINYCHSNLKSDRLDLYLAATCRFFLGNTSGIACLSSIFGVPCAITNLIPIGNTWYGKNDLIITKLLYSNRYNRTLSFIEIFNLGLGQAQFTKHYNDCYITPMENSEDDIFDLTVEMMCMLDSGKKERVNTSIIKKIDIIYNHFGYISIAPNLGSKFISKYEEILLYDSN